ncbi:chaperone protein ClpB [Clostridium ragsdalei P11]|uniref:Chaperone protein ClpB n=1 Tax=Clostridium ragsdalei P11 TaxID=1353534 RepID=A0A1A6AND6_9CLOT|nr:AAA family ATPase [Clostridium ragsdalei]OBR91576.1 chaperone protein ClpB [Clostridium ragsdalei P11]
MSPVLYVYEKNKLKKLQEKLSGYRFASIAYLLYKCDSLADMDKLVTEDIDNTIVDITNMIKDGNYYRTFTERYFWTLVEEYENVHFCLNAEFLTSFLELFPYFFNEKDINTEFCNDIIEREYREEEEKEYEKCCPLSLYVYKNHGTVQKLHEDGTLIPISSVIENYQGVLLQYNIDKIACIIKDEEIEYVDISSAIRTIKLRNDLIFPLEILLYRISGIKEIKYSLESGLLPAIVEFFPFTFAKEVYMNDDVDDTNEAKKGWTIPDAEDMNILADSINQTLKGHDVFKSDFKHNLLKFAFLNKMGERKILSILLCGESGIGKTEFAKIASQKMFSGESLIKINFGNYSNEGVLNSLIGSPLGYVGSEEGGELINKIATSKSRVILIDEFEKATPAVYNFFYELLEDGIFTDRHGIEHKLNGYIIIFTSNMTQLQYQKHIPNSLKSRFDMVYYFVYLPVEEKLTFIQNTASNLIGKLRNQFGAELSYDIIQPDLEKLVMYNNLRDIKRKIEDIVFCEFFKYYK